MAEESGSKGLNTIIGKGSTFEGTLNVMSSVRVEGIVRGKIKSTETLTIGGEGIVEAEIEVNSAIVSGKVVGNIHANDRVELESSASLHGDIITKQLIINEGAFFHGNCEMNGKKIETEK
jgi:cytoskeletal protein CcmA (bactofilin family)